MADSEVTTNEALRKIANTQDTTRILVDQLSRDMVVVRRDVEHLTTQVRKVTVELIEGNGRPSLITNVALIKADMSRMSGEVGELKQFEDDLCDRVTRLEQAQAAHAESRASRMPQQYQLRIAKYDVVGKAVAAVIGAITAIAVAYLAK